MSGDLFGDHELDRLRLRKPPAREWAKPAPASVRSLVVVAVLAAAPAWFFGMSLLTATLFVAGCVVTRAARNHRRLQQTLRAAAATVFCSFAELTFMVSFAPAIRLVFFGAIVGGAVLLYEWSIQH